MDIKEQIKDKVSMRDVLEIYGIYPFRGKNIYKCCFHEDHKPSANIIKNTDRFHCFVCNVTYDIFDFIQKKEGCTFKEAIQILDDRFHLGLTENKDQKQIEEFIKRQKIKEEENVKKTKNKQFEEKICKIIVQKLRFFEELQKISHPTRGDVRLGKWIKSDIFFYSIKQQERLSWIYDMICGFDPPICEYDYTIGHTKNDILKKIKRGEVNV